jgi:hypothetical protein
MATLTRTQLDRATRIPDDITVRLWKPNWNRGPVTNEEIGGDIYTSACWQWALWASVVGDRTNEDNLAVTRLYQNNSPIDPMTEAPRAELNVPEILAAKRADLRRDWNTAKAGGSTDDHKRDFMKTMMEAVIAANGMTVSNDPTAYSISMTVPRVEWYHWQHWAVGLHHNGQTRYVQTTPNNTLQWGTNNVWEAARAGHLTQRVYVTGLLQRHIDVIRTFLSIPVCSGDCWPRAQLLSNGNPAQWIRCSGDGRHAYCNECADDLQIDTTFCIPNGKRKCDECNKSCSALG